MMVYSTIAADDAANPGAPIHPGLQYRIGIVGWPSKPDLPWNEETLGQIKGRGFNAVQLNIAWLWRPADEILNFEDVVSGLTYPGQQSGVNMAKQDPQSTERRRRDLRHRIKLTRKVGLRSIFHVGLPYQGDQCGQAQMPQCTSDPAVLQRYLDILDKFQEEFPGVDDLLIYTYDQAAWLCSEFECARCLGIPLHERVVPFLNQLSARWHKLSGGGRVWWEPWELSAGQVYKSVEKLEPQTLGLMLHNSFAEVMPTIAVDHYVRKVALLAAKRKIPVILEGFFTSASEEVEHYRHIPMPLVTLRQLRSMINTPGVVGIKEYYGLYPTYEDPNLRATSLLLADPAISDDVALPRLAEPYGPVAAEVQEFWRLCSEAIELFPWDVTWAARKISESNPRHSLNAAFIRGQIANTPSWHSTRSGVFLKTDNHEPHPWLREDVQLRCEMAGERLEQAIALGRQIDTRVPAALRSVFLDTLRELGEVRRRALAFAYHLRETNLAQILRESRAAGRPYSRHVIEELLTVLRKDDGNLTEASLAGAHWIWHPKQRDDKHTVYLATTLTLPKERAVESASIIITADDEFDLFLNGQKIGSGKNWQDIQQWRISETLQPGANVIAVRAHNHTGPCGLIASVEVELDDGTKTRLVSGDKWLVAEEPPPGWPGTLKEGVSVVPASPIAPYGKGVWAEGQGPTLADAIALLERDTNGFLDRFLLVTDSNATPAGFMSWTSR